MRRLIIGIVMTPFIVAGFVVATAFIGACAGWEVATMFWDRMAD